jgi:tetratricopeptide (TPR) repeat protein
MRNKLITQAFLMLVVCLCLVPLASAKTVVEVPANQVLIIPVLYSGDSLDIRVDGYETLIDRIVSQQNLLTQELIVVGPFKTQKTLNLSADSVTLTKKPLKNPSDTEVQLLIKLRKISNTDPLLKNKENLKWIENQLENLTTELFSQPIIDYFRLTVGHMLIGASRSEVMLSLLSNRNRMYQQWLLLQCRYGNDNAHKITKKAEIIDLLGSISRTLINIRKNLGEIPESPNAHGLSTSIFTRNCSATIHDLVAQLTTTKSSSKYKNIDSEIQVVVSALIQHVETINTLAIRAKTYASSWAYYNMKDQHDIAEHLARKSIDNQLKITNDKASATALAYYYQNLATSLLRQGRFSETQNVLTKGLNTGFNISDHRSEILTFNKGYIYNELGAFDIAERYITKALEAHLNSNLALEGNRVDCKEIELSWKSATYLTRLATIYRHQNLLSKATKSIRCAMSIFEYAPSFFELSAFIENAKITFTNGDYKNAITQSLAILSDGRAETPLKLEALSVLIESRIKLTQFDQAEMSARTMAALLFAKNNMTNLTTSNLFDAQQYSVESMDYAVQKIDYFKLLILLCEMTRPKNCAEELFEKAKTFIQRYKAQLTYPQAWNAARYSLVESYVKASLNNAQSNDKEALKKLFDTLDNFYSVDLELEKRNYHSEANKPFSKSYIAYQNFLTAEKNTINSSGKAKTINLLLKDKIADNLHLFPQKKSIKAASFG